MSRISNAAGYIALPADRDFTPVLWQVTAVTLTNQTSAEAFFNSNSAYTMRWDLTEFEQIRLNFILFAGSASANTPRLRLRYRSTWSGTVSDYADIGTSEVSASLAGSSGDVKTSGWVDLATAAKDDVYVALTQIGGDGAADPTMFSISMGLR